MALIPQIDNQMENDVSLVEIPSKTYKLTNNRIMGFVDNIEAVRQSAYHILNTERYAYLIYDDNYGVELEQYIGKDFEYIETTIEDTLREALTHDLRITDIQINELNKIAKDKVEIKFTIISIYGDLQMEVNVNV